jgi:hypothetical protein
MRRQSSFIRNQSLTIRMSLLCIQTDLWVNRFNSASIRMELYGAAVSDADEAINLDPLFYKAFYRRAVANTFLGNLPGF